LLDNGSLWDDLLFFGSPKVDALNLDLVGTVILGDTSSMNPIISDTGKEIDLEFEGISFTNQNAIVRYINGLPNPWEGVDLQVSSAFFKNFIVEMNFDGSYIKLTNPDAHSYSV